MLIDVKARYRTHQILKEEEENLEEKYLLGLIKEMGKLE
jgi:hypothetical protein